MKKAFCTIASVVMLISAFHPIISIAGTRSHLREVRKEFRKEAKKKASEVYIDERTVIRLLPREASTPRGLRKRTSRIYIKAPQPRRDTVKNPVNNMNI